MRLLTLPGVFRPRSDSLLLAEIIAREPGLPGARVLDLCCGSGVIALSAAAGGGGEVVAVDLSRRAVVTTRLNAWRRGVRVRARRSDLFAAVPAGPFDLIASNPPYVPAPGDGRPRGAARAWDAGRDGRALLDPICRQAPARLAPGGVLLLVHSSVCGTDATCRTLAAAGLEVEVIARRRGALGPLLSERAGMLERRGLLEPGAREEEIVVVRGRRPG